MKKRQSKWTTVSRSYGISGNKEQNDVLSIPVQCTLKHQIQDLCDEGDNYQALGDHDHDPISDVI